MSKADEIKTAVRHLREEAEKRWAGGDMKRAAELQSSAAAGEAFYATLRRLITDVCRKEVMPREHP